MDDPALDPAEHAHALSGLSRLNTLSGAARSLYGPLKRLALRQDRPLKIVDVATGSGDVPVSLLRRAAREGINLDIVACDISPFALQAAQQRAERAGVRLETRRLDALAEDPPAADVLMCALFLHHLSDEDVRLVLEKMTRFAGRAVLISDLRRGWWGTTLAAAVPRVATRSHVVHVDALRSARAALSIGEIRSMSRGIACGTGWSVERTFPARMLIRWDRPPTTPSSSAPARPDAWPPCRWPDAV